MLGIDLGTSNSCCAYMKNGRVEFLEDQSYGSNLIPSVVVFDNEQQILAGETAVKVAHMYKKETIYEAKRLIGQSYDDPEVQKDIARFPYDVKSEYGVPKIVVENSIWGRREFYIEEISQHILKYISDAACKRLDVSEITEAVITIPIYFGDDQRTATKEAAELAGIKITHIINEPTAAALAFQFDNKSRTERNLLIYDFGGGTFDVCIVRNKGNHTKVLATDGDCHLGGADVDTNLINFIKSDIFQKHGVEVSDNDWKMRRRLRNMAEDAKKFLSTRYKYSLELSSVLPNIDYELELSRHQFEKLNDELFQKTIEITLRCIAEAKLETSQIHQVVLVGGSSRIPKIKEMLRTRVCNKINDATNPDLMVAYGAAVYASTLHGNKNEITFEDVLTLSLGTDVTGNKMSNIIKRNTSLPCECSKRYVTTYDNQTDMNVKIYQGERALASQNTLLGDMCVNDLTEAPAGGVVVEVKLSVDTEGILKVSAHEQNTENRRTLDIDIRDARPSAGDAQRKILEAELAREFDEAHVLLANKKAEFATFCENLENSAAEGGGEGSDDILREIEEAMRRVQNLTVDQIDEIQIITDNLSEKSNLT